MMKRNSILIGSIAAFAVILTVSIYLQGQQSSNLVGIDYIPKHVLDLKTGEMGVQQAEAASQQCNPNIEEVKSKVPFKLLVPTVLPDGYDLRSAGSITDDSILLKFSDKDTCGENLSLKDGAIYYAAGLLSIATTETNGADYVAKEHARFIDAGINDAQIFNINDTSTRYAVGYPAGVGESLIINEKNGEVLLTENYDYAADLWVVDDQNHTVYRITAFMPLEDLVAIGKSLE